MMVSSASESKVCKRYAREKPLDDFCMHAYTADRLHP